MVAGNKVLRPVILFFHGTFVHRRNGAHARMAALLRFLIGLQCRVILYSYADHPDCPWGEAEIARFARDYPGIELVLDRRPGLLRFATRARKYLTGLWPALTPRLLRLHVPGATPAYDALIRREPDAVALVNYANGLLDLNGLGAGPVIVETHDLDFVQFSKRFGHALTSRRIVAKFRSEMALLARAEALIAIAPTENGLFRTFFPEARIFFIPDYGLDATPAGGTVEEPDDEAYDLLFLGSDNPFNVDGLVGFLAGHGDFLAGRTLAVAGAVSGHPAVRAAAAAHPGVRLLGYVDAMAPLYARSRLVISPVDGTGLKIKVVEALAAGKPVFGSGHTLDGLPGDSAACAFPIEAPAMAAMLADEAARVAAGRAAIDYARWLARAGEAPALATWLGAEGAAPAAD